MSAALRDVHGDCGLDGVCRMSSDTVRVLQATAWYPPYNTGGTEVYLEGLIGALRAQGVDSAVLLPRPAGAPEAYAHAGTEIETYPVNAHPARGEMAEGRPHLGFDAFKARLKAHLKAYGGGIYHQHSWSRGCGLHHLKAAREAGLKTVLTVHVPANVCLRGTMLRFGAVPCDGRVEERRCGACWVHGRGLPRAGADAVASLPLALAQCARRAGMRAATVLAARALGAERRHQLAEMIASADRVVAVCGWLADALAANGMPPDKLILSRQGLPACFLDAARAAAGTPRGGAAQGPLQLVYVGRWHPVKGIDVVVRAVHGLPREVRVRLTIHAPPAAAGEEAAYERTIRGLAGGDCRIVFGAPLGRSEVATVMARSDALVVPSVWLETGPLVVLEAQAAGLYVMGSRLGGIAELVDAAGGGELIEAGNIPAWSDAIARLARRRASGALVRRPLNVRSMATVAAEMAAVYRSL